MPVKNKTKGQRAMNIILLSGGSGKRLWPLSNEVRSKQFLKILPSHESMLQRMFRMLPKYDTLTIATSANQVVSINSQLENKVNISIEPCRRDTFPAIALAALYLKDVLNVKPNENVVVCPIDPYVNSGYFDTLQKMTNYIEPEGLVLMGIEPTYPSAKYGYIIPSSNSEISEVKEFKEKPDVPTAEKYIKQGAMWNGGVFAFRLGYLLDKCETLLGTKSYKNLYENYESLTKISFDYAVVEKEKNIKVIRYSGTWKDLGTWNTLTEAMTDEVAGNAINPLCENTHIINELQIPLIALAVKDLAIAATPDGILITDKKQSDKLKDYVPDARPMYEKRIWGEYKVLDYTNQPGGENSLTKHLIIKPGQHLSYQLHEHRSEIWTFVSGRGRLILDDKVREVSRGDHAYISPGVKHSVEALEGEELHIIEVQIGSELVEDDIERFDWPLK